MGIEQTLNYPFGANAIREVTQTNKKCSTCGTPAPDETSAFCNRCGARLPARAPVLTCQKCGNTFTDPLSRFCNRCGSPLAPAVQAASPAIPAAAPGAVKGTPCPTCGFVNPGENRFYCKKCGAYIPKKTPGQKTRPEETAPVRRPRAAPVRVRPEGTGAAGQVPATPPVQPVVPKVPAVTTKVCPACGFTNTGEVLAYCKKCGASLQRNGPAAYQRPAGEGERSGLPPGGIRIKPDGMDAVRQGALSGAAVQPAVLSGTQEPVVQRPVVEPAPEPELPVARQQEAPRKRAPGSTRRISYGAAGVIALVLIIAIVAVGMPGILPFGSANATFPDLLNISAKNSTSPGLFESLSAAIFPNQTPVITRAPSSGATAKTVTTSAKAATTTAKAGLKAAAPALNQATTVVTDTPLTVAGS